MTTDQIVKQATLRITKARAALIQTQPFFGALSLRLKVMVTTNVQTAATDTVHIPFNPDFVMGLTQPELIGLWAHEVCHIALGHPWRLQGRDHAVFNEAADHAVNHILISSGFDLPEGALARADLQHKAAEEIYKILGAERPKGGADSNGPPQTSPGSPDSPLPDSGVGSDGTIPHQSPDYGNCGSFSEPANDSGKSLSETDAAKTELEWQVAAVQAANAAKSAGMMPAGVLRAVEEGRQPRYDLSDLLRRFLSSAVPSDYRALPPNRRYLAHGLIMPTLKPAKLGPIVLAVDVSGSIGQPQLDLFSDILNGILDDVTPERVTVIYVDTRITSVEEYEPMDFPVALKAQGGGGTDFRPAFDYVKREGIEPVALVYLTDLYCSSFPVEPDYPCLWITTGRQEAPFGDIVLLEA